MHPSRRERSLRVAATAAAVGFLVAWPLYAEVYRHSGDRPLAWEELTAQVAPPRFAKPETSVFDDAQALVRHLRARGSRFVLLDESSSKHVLVAVGPRSSTGYGLHVVRAVEERGRIVLSLREDAPRLGAPVEPRVTYPFMLLALPASDKPTRVELEGRP